jgi:putative MFS transporter
MAQGLTIGGVVLSMGYSSLLVMAPTVLSLVLVTWFGTETRGRDLRDLEAHGDGYVVAET